MDQLEPASFDKLDPDRCLNRALVPEVSSRPVQCVQDAFFPCEYVDPLEEPEIRARLRRLSGGE